jgi:hypothetical protein
MAVEIAANPVFRAGVPKALFQKPQSLNVTVPFSWDVASDGKRFLFPVLSQQAGVAPFTVVLNWTAGLSFARKNLRHFRRCSEIPDRIL